ncbi:MAG TPA: RNA polymerase subunit sigma-24 [Chloroflexi bacterium]|nr:RNA polymerase subunit sigma-24 [Chloroflexota bacterium]
MVDRSTDPIEHEDAMLIQRAKDGDADAYGELYERYANSVFRFVYSQTSNRFDAEDITADVFLRAWRSLSRYKERGFSFSAYLFRIARNVLIDRRRKQRPVAEISEDEVVNLPDMITPDPSLMFSAKIRHQELVSILAQLREDYRTVLVLRFLNELSPEETSQVMGRSVGSVRVLQHRALSALRKLIPAQGLEL